MADDNYYQPKPPLKFTRSQIAAMTPKEYADNRADIIKAQLTGNIKDDISTLRENIDAQVAKQRGDNNGSD